jgi:hypothetical protein
MRLEASKTASCSGDIFSYRMAWKSGKLPSDSPYDKAVKSSLENLLASSPAVLIASPASTSKERYSVKPSQLCRRCRGEPHPRSDYPAGLCLSSVFPLIYLAVPATSRAAQRGFLLHHTSAANTQIVLDSKQASPRKKDRLWRRWISFCAESGFRVLTLSSLSGTAAEQARHARLSVLYRVAKWSPVRNHSWQASRPWFRQLCAMPQSQLARRFRGSFERSPLRRRKLSYYPPSSPFEAFDKPDPPQSDRNTCLSSFRRFFTSSSTTAKGPARFLPSRRHRARSFLFAIDPANTQSPCL